MKNIITLVLAVVFILLIPLTTNAFYLGWTPGFLDPVWVLLISHSLAALGAVYFSGNAFSQWVVRGKLAEGLKNVLTMGYLVMFLFLVLEAVFTFVPRSNGSGGLSMHAWMSYYWGDVNAQGHRYAYDYDEVPDTEGRIIVVGDSFTEGFGIRHREDRYSNKLETLMGGETGIQVVNMGRNGDDPSRILPRLEAYPMPADVLIIQHTLNDIDRIGLKHIDYIPQRQLAGSSPLVRIPFETSFLLNYLYEVSLKGILMGADSSYLQYMEHAYSDSTLVAEHITEIKSMIDFGKARNMDVVILSFPSLANPDFCPFPELGALARSENVAILEVEDLLDGIEISDRVVNSNDHHPSVLLHGLVAEALLKLISD